MKVFREDILLLLGSFILLFTFETTSVAAQRRRKPWQDPKLDFTFPPNNAWGSTRQGMGNYSPSLQKALQASQEQGSGRVQRFFQRLFRRSPQTDIPQRWQPGYGTRRGSEQPWDAFVNVGPAFGRQVPPPA
ncbi:uncharacterized protein LOC142769157 [Rhipicephalus microplus]|uniref:uncharacterized protein LOC142769157 n=1 Tax=Rhipicephalus microplus TaxID=6941 RepID=UPI003F6AAC72